MTRFIYIIITSILLSSCLNSDNDRKASHLDSLINEYKNLDTLVHRMEYEKAENLYKDYKHLSEESQELLNNFNPKKIKNLKFTSDLKIIKRSIKPYLETHKNLSKKIPKNIKELKNLQTDIEHNIYTDEEISLFLKQEKEHLLKIQENLNVVSVKFQNVEQRIIKIKNKIQDLKHD